MTYTIAIAGYHAIWEKVAKFLDIEMNVVPFDTVFYNVTKEGIETLISEHVINNKTIAICLTLGSTLTGQIDDIEEINTLLSEYNSKAKFKIPIHIDAAIGGFVFPFIQSTYEWDFRSSEVQSINVSNHKYGLVYPGLGTLVFRNYEIFDKSLLSNIYYLEGQSIDFNLNFTRSSFNVVLQYYNFLKLGIEGYKKITTSILERANIIATTITSKYENFRLISHSRLPQIVLLHDYITSGFSVFDLADVLKRKGWVIAAYELPYNSKEKQVIRIVVRDSFSTGEIKKFLLDFNASMEKVLSSSIKRKNNNKLISEICQ